MPFDPQRLRDWDFGDRLQRYDARDAILYALGVGLPFGDDDLAYVYEDRLRVLPSFAVTLATPGMWPREPALAIDWAKLLHMSQSARFHVPLPSGADVTSRAHIAELWDRGADKGGVCVVRREVVDAANGTVYCTIDQTVALRGNGGFGGAPMPRVDRPTSPDRAPDHAQRVVTAANAALIYRLSGDVNPLHIDPAVARSVGFPRPILHGLASYGTACAVVLRAFCDGDPARMRGLDLRFAGVVYPGDALDFACWRDGERVLFEARVGDKSVIDQGVALLA